MQPPLTLPNPAQPTCSMPFIAHQVQNQTRDVEKPKATLRAAFNGSGIQRKGQKDGLFSAAEGIMLTPDQAPHILHQAPRPGGDPYMHPWCPTQPLT